MIGVSEDGYREHLGLWTGASESLQSWGAVMEDLVKRGLTGVRCRRFEVAQRVEFLDRFFDLRQQATQFFLDRRSRTFPTRCTGIVRLSRTRSALARLVDIRVRHLRRDTSSAMIDAQAARLKIFPQIGPSSRAFIGSMPPKLRRSDGSRTIPSIHHHGATHHLH
ncbi:MAG: transposase [Phycisphaerales bacterium]